MEAIENKYVWQCRYFAPLMNFSVIIASWDGEEVRIF